MEESQGREVLTDAPTIFQPGVQGASVRAEIMKTVDHEQRYFDALKRITLYMTVAQLRRRAEIQYGLEPIEALEAAYENIISEAQVAIKGKRRPKY